MQITVHTKFEEIPMTSESWNSLADACENSSVFVRYEWVSQWWKHFGSEYQLFFLTAESEGKVIGFAPFMRDSRREIRFIGDINSDYMEFIAPIDRNKVVNGFVKFLASRKDTWAVIHLRNIRRECELIPVLKAACAKRALMTWTNYSVGAPTLLIKGNRSEVVRTLSKYSMRRPARRLRKKGDITYRVFPDTKGAAPYWAIFFAQHISRWESLGKKSSFSIPEYGQFIRTLFEQDTDEQFTHFPPYFLMTIRFHFILALYGTIA